MTRVIGVDPSFNRTGWCVLTTRGGMPRVETVGTIVPKGEDRTEKLLSIYRQFQAVMEQWQPKAVYLERPGAWQRKGGTRRETVEVLAMGRAALLLVCAQRNIRVTEVDVHAVRLHIFGRVNARAEDVLEFLSREQIDIPLRPRGGPDLDVANAIITGLYGLLL